MRLLPLLLLMSCATSKPIAVHFDQPEDFEGKGPFFACLKDGEKREMRCIDMAEFLQALAKIKADKASYPHTEL